MSFEAHIKTNLESYLNLESALKDYYQAKDEVLHTYEHLLNKRNGSETNYNIHTAAPILSAYNEMKNLDKLIQETIRKLNETGEKIKEYIHALHGGSLDAHFTFDNLSHRAGIHTFYIEGEELKVRHSPVS